MRTRSKTSAEKRERDAKMQHFLNTVAIWQVAAGSIAQYGSFSAAPDSLVAAFVDQNRYYSAVFPEMVRMFDTHFVPVGA